MRDTQAKPHVYFMLPQPCELFGVSAAALLEVPPAVKNKNLVHDFCTYAAKNGINETTNALVSRLDVPYAVKDVERK